ncbi:hypothetical protein DRN74_02325 [Candidatus Micrarchaeota archaeon]|nr:MAG: hypothetical protein DRN74_02325 [Candidatus Micrarchaeota archaeon]
MKLLIVGVDPGSTVAIAYLDLDGKLLALESGKNISINEMAARIERKGRMLILATDKKQLPSTLKKLSALFSCKVYSPPESLSRQEKIELVKGYPVTNVHERDALASALKAYKHFKAKLMNLKKRYPNNFEKKVLESFIGAEKRERKAVIIKKQSRDDRKLRQEIRRLRELLRKKDEEIEGLLSERGKKRAMPLLSPLVAENRRLLQKLNLIAEHLYKGDLRICRKEEMKDKTNDRSFYERLKKENKNVQLIDILYENESFVLYIPIERYESKDSNWLEKIVEEYRKRRKDK